MPNIKIHPEDLDVIKEHLEKARLAFKSINLVFEGKGRKDGQGLNIIEELSLNLKTLMDELIDEGGLTELTIFQLINNFSLFGACISYLEDDTKKIEGLN